MSVAADPTHKNQLQALQIVRAIASTSVVYFHIGSTPCFGGTGYLPCFGGFGVDIFFVLSGFVMAMVAATGQSWSRFAINRISRIAPLYWVLTTVILALAALTPNLFGSTTANVSNYLRSIFFIPYFKENGTLMPMLFVGWSLNYEMFFYLCVGLALFAARNRFLWVTTGLVAAAYVGLGHYADGRVLNRFFGNELLYEFILGMLAFVAYDKRYLSGLPTLVAGAVGVGGYVLMATAEASGAQLNRLLIYGVPSFLMVCSAVSLEGVVRSAPPTLRNVLISAGDASYATYLSHAYVTQGMRKVLSQEGFPFSLSSPLGVILTLFAALLTGAVIYKWVDKPLSHKTRTILERLCFTPWDWRLPSQGDRPEALPQDSSSRR